MSDGFTLPKTNISPYKEEPVQKEAGSSSSPIMAFRGENDPTVEPRLPGSKAVGPSVKHQLQ